MIHAAAGPSFVRTALAVLMLVFAIPAAGMAPRSAHGGGKPGANHQPIVRELRQLLGSRPDLLQVLATSLTRADYRGIRDLPRYYQFLDRLVTHVPTERDLTPFMKEFYYLISLSPGNRLQKDPAFSNWTVKFAENWGGFLDTPASAPAVQDFVKDPAYRMDDYSPTPSGWRTFNQFFAREVKPGRRPVEGLCDDGIVVSPADSVFQGQWPISEDASITVKGRRLAIGDLLADSPYRDRFKGGTFTHSFLNVNDYPAELGVFPDIPI